MTNTRRKDFETWKIEKANKLLETSQLIAEKMIKEGCTDSGPTRATALLIALDQSDDTGWDAWQAAIKTQKTISTDLLSALKRLVVCHGSDGIEYSGAHPMAEARAVIAKAEANT